MKLILASCALLIAVFWVTSTNDLIDVPDGKKTITGQPTEIIHALNHLARQAEPPIRGLLEGASRDLDAGRLEEAAASLERAVRIEPDNALLWHYLGQVRLLEKQYVQAEALALKSQSLTAQTDIGLREDNEQLLVIARRDGDIKPTANLPQAPEIAAEARRPSDSESGTSDPDQDPAPFDSRTDEPSDSEVAMQPERRTLEREVDRFLSWLETQRRRPSAPAPDRDSRGESAPLENSRQHFAASSIPAEYLPPPGSCRVWLPDRAPKHQPPPGECRDLERKVPQGAQLIQRLAKAPASDRLGSRWSDRHQAPEKCKEIREDGRYELKCEGPGFSYRYKRDGGHHEREVERHPPRWLPAPPRDGRICSDEHGEFECETHAGPTITKQNPVYVF